MPGIGFGPLLPYAFRMHEMSIATNLLSLIRQEMAKHGASRLVRVTIRHGALANIVPESLAFAFEVLTVDTDLDGAVMEMVEEPLRLVCGNCGKEFSPEPTAAAMFSPCPDCGEEFGHKVLAGREMYLERLEVE